MKLNQAYEALAEILPAWLNRFLLRVRRPQARPLRLLAGSSLIAGSFLFILPFLGLEMLPLGLLLLAEDIPFLRKPVGSFILWCVAAYKTLRERWRRLLGR